MPKVIQDEMDILAQKIETLASWNTIAEIVEKIVSEIPSGLAPRMSCGIQLGQLYGVLVHVNLKTMDEITSILKLFSAAGFHIQGDPKDYEEIGRRSWDLRRNPEDGTPVVLSAFFNSYEEEQVCRFVEVGKKEVPVYKLLCDPPKSPAA